MTDSLTDQEVRRLQGFLNFNSMTSESDLRKQLQVQFGDNRKLNDFLFEKSRQLVQSDDLRRRVAEEAKKKGYVLEDSDNISSTVLYGNSIHYIRDRNGRIKTAVVERASHYDIDREIQSLNLNIKRHEEEIERLKEKLKRVREK